MRKIHKKSTRFFVAVAAGIIGGIAVGSVIKWSIAPLAGWDVAVLTLLVMLWSGIKGRNSSETEAIATRNDMGRSVLDIIVLGASLASLGAVIKLLVSKQSGAVDIGFALISIVLSWACVHSLYMVHYAWLYFHGTKGGVNFEGTSKPTFSDFAYLAFTIGMTYQVSDTTFGTSEFRRTALEHALLSFLFGTAIIATTINFVVNLG